MRVNDAQWLALRDPNSFITEELHCSASSRQVFSKGQSNNKIKSSRQDKCVSVCISIFQIIHMAFSREQLDADLSLPQLFKK